MKNYILLPFIVFMLIVPSFVFGQIQSRNRAITGKLLMELEANINWNAVKPEWANIRDRWILQCKGEHQMGMFQGEAISQALMELEANLVSDAMNQPAWSQRREFWRKQCEETTLGMDWLLAKQLVMFEENLKWGYVTEEWAERRDSWVQECKNISDPVEEANPNAEEEVMKFLGK